MKRIAFLTGIIASVLSVTSFAGGWNWLDPNQDGTLECYYFNDDGNYLTNTTTPDGYQVDENGAWIHNGVVQVTYSSTTDNAVVLNSTDFVNGNKNTSGLETGKAYVTDDSGKVYVISTELSADSVRALQDYTNDYYKAQLTVDSLKNAAGDRPILHDPDLNGYRGRKLTDSEVQELVSKYGLWVQSGEPGTHVNIAVDGFETAFGLVNGHTYALIDYIDCSKKLVLIGDDINWRDGTYFKRSTPDEFKQRLEDDTINDRASAAIFGTDWLQS